jgi:ATP-binding cassette subfamily C protein
MASSTPKHTDVQHAFEACRTSFAWVFAVSCGHNLLLLAPAIYLLQLYDRVLASRSVETLVMLTMIAVLAIFVGGVLDVLRRAALARIGGWLEDRLRPAVFNAAFDAALHNRAGAAADACRELSTLRQFIGSPANLVLFDAPWTPVFLGLLMLMHPLLGGIGVAGALVIIVLALANELVTRAPLARARNAEAKISTRLGAALQNAQTIRAMGMLDGAAGLICKDVADARAAQQAATYRSEVVQVLAKPVRTLVQALIMGAAVWLVLRYDASAAIIFASSLLLGRGLAPIEGAIAAWKTYGAARNAYGRLTQVLEAAAPSTTAKPRWLPKLHGAISVEGITFMPPGSGSAILQNVSLRLAPGECLGVIGPTGAGKSTLGRIMLGIATPTVGRVRLDGVEIAVWLNSGGARHFGYLPQETELFEGTIRDNIARLRDADIEDVIEAARLVGLHDTIMQLPQTYDTEVGKNGIRLSGGQRQCIALARAFFGKPQFVVLDEPNTSLDQAGEEVLYEAVEQMKAAGVTIVIITHRMGMLAATDKIVIIQRGAVKAFGESEEIYEKFFSRPQLDAEKPAVESDEERDKSSGHIGPVATNPPSLAAASGHRVPEVEAPVGG